MSDRLFNILSGILLIIVIFSIFMMAVNWFAPVLKFAEGVGNVIIIVGSSVMSYVVLKFRKHWRS